MITKWTSHLSSQEEKDKFVQEVQSSKRVLDRQLDIIDEMEQELNKAEISTKNYEIPNWDYRQAHNNGYRQCLHIMKRIADLDQRIIRPNE